MVIAAVYCTVELKLSQQFLKQQHWAGLKPYTSYSYFAEPCVFSKQSLLSFICHHFGTHSPEVIVLFCRVPSALLSHALVYSTFSPVSVYSTVFLIKAFSWKFYKKFQSILYFEFFLFFVTYILPIFFYFRISNQGPYNSACNFFHRKP